MLLASPERSVVRYDVRAVPSLDDATRADLARDTKQILSYAGITAALGGAPAFDAVLKEVVSGLTRPVVLTYADDGTDRMFIVEQRGLK